MDKSKIKYLVGIYAAAMCIMGMLVPVPIVASVAAAFPNENIAAVQMIIGIIPLMMALSAMLVSSQPLRACPRRRRRSSVTLS